MKVYTYNNLTTGRFGESASAKSEAQLIDMYNKMNQQIEIIDSFNPDAMFKDLPPGNPNQDLGDLEPPLPGTQPSLQQNNERLNNKPPIQDMFFETNGIKFKIVNGVVSRKDWIEIKGKDKDDYKIVKVTKIKGGKTRQQEITKDVSIFVNDWIEVEQQSEK